MKNKNNTEIYRWLKLLSSRLLFSYESISQKHLKKEYDWLRRRTIQNKMQYTTVSAKQRMNNYAFVALFLWQKTNNDIGKENSQHSEPYIHTYHSHSHIPIPFLYVSACFCGSTIRAPSEVRWASFSEI